MRESLIKDPLALLEATPAASLDDAAREALAYLLGAPLCFSPVACVKKSEERKALAKLLRSCGIPPEAAARWFRGMLESRIEQSTIDGLVTGGWMDRSDAPMWGPMVTLTPWGAARLGVELHEYSDDSEGASRWGLPELVPRPIKMGRGFATSNNPLALALAADPELGPLESLIAEEEWLTRQATTEDGRLAVDAITGRVKVEPILLFGLKIKREKSGKKKAPKRRKAKAA
jgi:hypothetical protein